MNNIPEALREFAMAERKRQGSMLHPVFEADLAIEAASEIDRLRKALFIAASQHHGGHSATGGAIADALGIPFPVTMPNLEKRAKEFGFNSKDLWPWLAPMRAGKTS